MPEITDEMLMQHVDGTLPAAEGARIDTRLATDPALRRRRAAFEITSHEEMAPVFTPISESTVPDRLLQAITGAPVAIRHRGLVDRMITWLTETLLGLLPKGTSPVAAMTALAACLAVAGYGSLWLARNAPSSDPFQTVLETARSGSSIRFADARGTRVLTPRLSFEDQSGRFCRRYVLDRESAGSLAGVACRDDTGRWRIDLEVDTGPAGQHTSAGAGTEALDQRIGSMIKNDPYGSSEENRLLKSGWRRLDRGEAR